MENTACFDKFYGHRSRKSSPICTKIYENRPRTGFTWKLDKWWYFFRDDKYWNQLNFLFLKDSAHLFRLVTRIYEEFGKINWRKHVGILVLTVFSRLIFAPKKILNFGHSIICDVSCKFYVSIERFVISLERVSCHIVSSPFTRFTWLR